jgi:hypothetical protein
MRGYHVHPGQEIVWQYIFVLSECYCTEERHEQEPESAFLHIILLNWDGEQNISVQNRQRILHRSPYVLVMNW